jgi:hypothetical protein
VAGHGESLLAITKSRPASKAISKVVRRNG